MAAAAGAAGTGASVSMAVGCSAAAAGSGAGAASGAGASVSMAAGGAGSGRGAAPGASCGAAALLAAAAPGAALCFGRGRRARRWRRRQGCCRASVVLHRFAVLWTCAHTCKRATIRILRRDCASCDLSRTTRVLQFLHAELAFLRCCRLQYRPIAVSSRQSSVAASRQRFKDLNLRDDRETRETRDSYGWRRTHRNQPSDG